jgi:hypothetical protein
LDLIENKFRPLIKDFIPIVVNISEFGRLIQNSIFNQPKVRYTNIHKQCIGKTLGSKALLIARLYADLPINKDLTIFLENENGSELTTPVTVTWKGTIGLTEYAILTSLRNITVNPNYTKVTASTNDGVFTLAINVDWYYANFSMNPNNVKLKVSYDNNGTTIIKEWEFDYGSLDKGKSDCGSIEYKLPPKAQEAVWVYYDSENQPPTYIYNADENNDNTTYLNFKD